MITNPFIHSFHTFFNISKKIGKRDEAAAALQGILKRTGLRDESAASVHFKLGRYYDETGEYDRAFRHYRQANELTPQRFSKAASTRSPRPYSCAPTNSAWSVRASRSFAALPAGA